MASDHLVYPVVLPAVSPPSEWLVITLDPFSAFLVVEYVNDGILHIHFKSSYLITWGKTPQCI